MNGSDIWQIAGFAVGLLAVLAANNRWRDWRHDRKHERIHERIDEIHDEYMRKSDLTPRLDRIEASIERTNERLDSFAREISKSLSDLAVAAVRDRAMREPPAGE